MLKVYPLEVSCSWEVTRTNESVCRAGWKLSVALKECYEFGVKQVVSKDLFCCALFFSFFFFKGEGEGVDHLSDYKRKERLKYKERENSCFYKSLLISKWWWCCFCIFHLPHEKLNGEEQRGLCKWRAECFVQTNVTWFRRLSICWKVEF